MQKIIINKIKKMDGFFLGIGISEELEEKVKKINFSTITLLESKDKPKKKLVKKENKKRFFKFDNKETVSVKKLRKSFKKKSIDVILCDYKYIKKYTKNFVIDSVYLNKGKLLIYGNDENIEDLIYKYKRYTDDIEVINKDGFFLIIVNNEKTKNFILKDIFYLTVDSLSGCANVITDILIN